MAKKQNEKIGEYLKEFLDLGYSTKPCNRSEAERAVSDSYEYLGLARPKEFVWFDSPYAALEYIMEIAPDKNVNQGYAASYGNLESYWISYYAFLAEQTDIPSNLADPERAIRGVEIARRIATHCGIYWTFENVVVMSERPAAINVPKGAITRKGNEFILEVHRAHNPEGPIFEYKDGTGHYSLNGVRMPLWLFETPKNDLDPKRILGITNVEQRSEAIAWFGMERLLEHLDCKVLDTGTDASTAYYELLSVDIGVGRPSEYLKMVNPSTDEIHIEAVDPGCLTIKDALAARWPSNLKDKYGYQDAKYRA